MMGPCGKGNFVLSLIFSGNSSYAALFSIYNKYVVQAAAIPAVTRLPFISTPYYLMNKAAFNSSVGAEGALTAFCQGLFCSAITVEFQDIYSTAISLYYLQIFNGSCSDSFNTEYW